MQLRQLELQDAPLMWEWMQDSNVIRDLNRDFRSKTVGDCRNFIHSVEEDKNSLHLAVVNDKDEYMGTVSLKHINRDYGCAEFAIVLRSSAIGKGYAGYAMEEIIRIGLEEMNLQTIYWCVSPANKRAVRFYEKSGYEKIEVQKIEEIINKDEYSSEQLRYYDWFRVQGGEEK